MASSTFLIYAVAFIGGYVSGSVPYGLILAQMGGLGDVRQIGSGNIGATNVLRTGSKKIAIATLLCDVLKGTIPVLIALYFGGTPAGLAVGFGAFIGHILPVWLKFKGGKGVATYLGVLFGLYWPLGLIFIALWLALSALFRFSSLSSLAASVALPAVALLLARPELAIGLAAMAVIIIIVHRENISRLFNGTESKISLSSKKA